MVLGKICHWIRKRLPLLRIIFIRRCLIARLPPVARIKSLHLLLVDWIYAHAGWGGRRLLVERRGGRLMKHVLIHLVLLLRRQVSELCAHVPPSILHLKVIILVLVYSHLWVCTLNVRTVKFYIRVDVLSWNRAHFIWKMIWVGHLIEHLHQAVLLRSNANIQWLQDFIRAWSSYQRSRHFLLLSALSAALISALGCHFRGETFFLS